MRPVSGRTSSPASGESGGSAGASISDPQSDPLRRVGDRLEEMLRQFEEVKKTLQDDRSRMTSIESMVSKVRLPYQFRSGLSKEDILMTQGRFCDLTCGADG